MDFPELLDICFAYEAAKYIGSFYIFIYIYFWVKLGKTWDELRKDYEIPEEMTKDIIDRMHKDYDWAYSDSKN